MILVIYRNLIQSSWTLFNSGSQFFWKTGIGRCHELPLFFCIHFSTLCFPGNEAFDATHRLQQFHVISVSTPVTRKTQALWLAPPLFFLCTEWHFAAVGVENTADYSMVTKQTVGKGLPTTTEILVSSLSEHVNEAQLAWRPLCPWDEVSFGSQSPVPMQGEKCDLWWKQNEFVSTSRRHILFSGSYQSLFFEWQFSWFTLPWNSV